VVVALKSRTAPVEQAVAQSLAAARWLRAQGATQIYFKVCSTFDSTPRGNIGPVTEALMDELGAGFVVITPAFPENGRTIFKGHLFVGDLLLSDSPMKHHPLTPMTDANLVRVMQAQLDGQRGRRVDLIDYRVVAQGPEAIGRRIEALRAEGVAMAVVDGLNDDDLRVLARAVASLPLVVAGSGLAIGIPVLHGLQPDARTAALPQAGGARAVVSGSCSAATNAQVATFLADGGAGFAIDPLQLAAGRDLAAEALAWAQPLLGAAPLLVYATAEPAAVRAVQQQLGAEAAGALVEQALSRIALGLVEAGAGQLIVAGGETSGACVQRLGITQLRIGPQIDPGVPWCHAATPARAPGLHLALKSGNFGGPDFFHRAFDRL
jgi:3-dehydrotetronate 4-kinase